MLINNSHINSINCFNYDKHSSRQNTHTCSQSLMLETNTTIAKHADGELDISKKIQENFNLLRVGNNDAWPSFF